MASLSYALEVTEAAYHHGDLRSALLRASLELIEQGGVQALSLREAARLAGVSSGAPYHHFPNRSALLAAIAMEGFEALGAAMQRRMEGLSNPVDRLSAAGEAYVDFALTHRAHFRVMFRPELADRSQFSELEETAHCVFQDLVDLVTEAHGYLPTDTDREHFVLLAWSMCHGLASLIIDGPLSEPFQGISVPTEQMGPAVVGMLSALLARGGRD